ncbi:hypothetical protein [Enterococcus faecium]|uniref:hypothetical protein n=1 Tax=Enterococcus faecium TaxID=1352 RepID=UPI00220B84E2|nr:hypothetical protein [Enterococcus faecium]BDP92868.1 hypothetical protein EfmGK923_30410 [Enterococcus faecium]BDP96060.1 hypothetical protein EfmGK941_30650 [Enterococcus faecium]BDP99246.1 hypothetical protein EfmGK961_30620 [Enterococcus faecium]
MTELEFKRQKSLVDSVLESADEETIEEWVELTAEDYWYGLTIQAEYLANMIKVLGDSGVNTDSIRVMSYVDKAINDLVY